ncbi:hypothetical protein ACSNOK_26725 [Streptomyces sp. URMC 126]|uniref:hypothetical protein n=1 Tax=Streptomyces sp. URMC 126 TaxID=3423401 RepID=UPI003F196C44
MTAPPGQEPGAAAGDGPGARASARASARKIATPGSEPPARTARWPLSQGASGAGTQTAAYLGMFAPYAVTLLSGAFGVPAPLGAGAVLAALTCGAVAAAGRRP